jgi:hypothetical protein
MTDRELMTMTRDALFLANTKHWTTNQIGEAINALNARLSAPDREWVSLTDHEVWEAIDYVLEGGGWLDVARVLEQVFKEKNT